jgi:hypothetical protein
MKKLTTYLSILTLVAIFALPVAARTSIAQPDNELQDQCTQEAKTALYKTFREARQADQAKAYDAAKKYLACPAGEVTPETQAIIDYLKKWVTAYEEGSKKIKCRQLLYNDQKFVEAFALCKEILAAEPENLKVLVDLGASGYQVAPLKNPGLSADAVTFATKALQMIESGKTIDDWAPLAGKDVAVAYLNYTIGSLTLEKDPAAALKNLLKAAQFETPLKKSPFTYAYIAGSYEMGPYAKLSDAYTAQHKGKDETPESKLALANINQIVDRMIDGYARAVALATDPKLAEQKAAWQQNLTDWYKFRNADKTDGLPELIAGILAKPLPPEPTPLTSLPPAPAVTPAANTGTNGTSTAPAPNGTTTPSKPNPATSTTGTKPAAAKPDRPRNRH